MKLSIRLKMESMSSTMSSTPSPNEKHKKEITVYKLKPLKTIYGFDIKPENVIKKVSPKQPICT